MKICPKCGSMYADGNMFCESCGSKLITQVQGQQEPGKGILGQGQQELGQDMQGSNIQSPSAPCPNPQSAYGAPGKKKKSPLLFAIPVAAILIILAVVFLFWDKLPFGNKEPGTQETVQQEPSGSKKAGPENGTEQDSGKKDSGMATESSGQNIPEGGKPSSGEKPESQKDISGKDSGSQEGVSVEKTGSQEDSPYADSDINGVDNAYVQVTGTVDQENGIPTLKLQKASSVCAYNVEEKIIQKKKVKSITLDGSDMEEYLGDTVEIKGKLSVNFDGEFCLQPVKTEVKQQAVEETGSGKRYQLIQADVTWEEAFSDCISRGGILAQINSEEEFQKITGMIEEQGMQNVHFYLGGRRDADGWKYYWSADAAGRLEGELNPEGDSWASGHWMENEPSFTSDGDTELYMNLIYYKEKWVFNDVPSDITQYYPGKTGYICEFKE